MTYLSNRISSDTKYTLVINYNEIGSFIKANENKHTIITTDFNRWVATGEFKKNSYKIFDRESGKIIATTSKKHSQASTFSVQCDYGQNEPFVIFMTVLIDVLFDEE